VGKLHNRLTCRYDLTWFRQRFHDGSICISDEERVIALVARYLFFSFQRRELRLGSVGSSPHT
jgi:hypothetical protein